MRVFHGDLHNHTLASDGDGRAEEAFASMRRHGVDVAALTDHSGVGKLQGSTCSGCAAAVGIDESEWRHLGDLADAANDEGSFVAIRGFEWSSPVLGHMNVWFSRTWTDPLATAGVGPASGASFLLHEWGDDNPLPAEVQAQVNELLQAVPDGAVSMAGFYDWLRSEPTRPVVGGGLDGLVGFNHPGREGGRFGHFAYDAGIADRVVSIEMFNRGEDYLFEGVPAVVSPLVQCLDAGWRVGIIGVSDEHGTNWGEPEGKGRSGLWLPTAGPTRAGVMAAMRSRRFFATRERGLRFDATADGVPMGGDLPAGTTDVEVLIDIDRGSDWYGRSLRVQLLQSDRPLPEVVYEADVVVPAGTDPVIRLAAPVDPERGWVVLRISDPALPADDRAPVGSAYAAAGHAVAYASPWFVAGADRALPVPGRTLRPAALGLAGTTTLRAEHG